MKILALNATSRPKQTTSRLVQQALEGAASQGAATEMVLLKNLDIRYCTNCLTCYQDLESQIAPCILEDDVRGVLEKIKEADGVIFASPVHCGFVTGLMTVFLQRAAWTLCRPTGELLGLKGCPQPRLTDKTRAVATIVSAGSIPPELRSYCDLGTPWMLDLGTLIANGSAVGDLYAAAFFPRELSGQDWQRAFLLRELTEGQLQEAFQLGVAMAQALKEGRVAPYDPLANLPQPQQQS
ncbi:MAG: flavodoxin family protein [Thermodesulfobacteriota bacterium]